MPKQSHTPYCTSRMRLGKEMGMRVQGTQAGCVVPPWMCPVPGASQPWEDCRGQFRVGISDTPRVGCSDPPSALGRALASSYRRILQQKSTRSGGINPQQDPCQPQRVRDTWSVPPSATVLCSCGQRGIAFLATDSPLGMGCFSSSHLPILSVFPYIQS